MLLRYFGRSKRQIILKEIRKYRKNKKEKITSEIILYKND